MLAEYIWEEIRTHTTPTSLWVVVNGDVLDLTSFLDKHPGGAEILLEFGGQDATHLFNQVHPHFAKQAQTYKIGVVAAATPLV